MPRPLIAVISQGCAANFGEGEQIAGVLKALDLNIVFGIPESRPSAYLLNFCTVKGNASALKLVRNAEERHPDTPLIITGCVPQDLSKALNDLLLKNVFPESLQTDKNRLLENPQSILDFLGLKRAPEYSVSAATALREKPFLGIVPISEGCLDACSYCSTRLVKGLHRSIEEEIILEKISAFVNDGCKEIFLTGQDTGCYGFDRKTNLAKLVKKILKYVPGDYKLRLGMGNPRHLIHYYRELLDVFSDSRVYKFIHLPVQSGSDAVLKLMNRRHSTEEYRKLVKAFQTQIPDICLSTDLIVGFPGESERDFEMSLALVRETEPSLCNITRFVARPGTPAAKMQNKVSAAEANRRSALLSAEFQAIALRNNQKFIGNKEMILIEKEGFRKGTTIGRNGSYRPVALQGACVPGTQISVEITGAETFALLAKECTL
ncbi:MAG: tRNA (N(6)-L-threonylcarbamoyladenosine(37)-C(2))-methylthiotransferase [Fibrobacter sp.]|nr:tRNA (N(6)-L-threonylcarbamoyladenosine(37)-C(2))-methylthiotransferase [Fibrobacter sp.]